MAGEAGDMRRQADVMEQIGKTMTATYAAKTGLAESEIKAMMDAETWLTAAEAKAKGFIDEVYPAEGQAFAMAPGSAPIVAKFTHVPAELRNSMKEAPNNQQLSPEQKADSIFSSFSCYDWAAGIREEFTGGSITEEQARQKILNKLAEGVIPLAGPEAISVYSGNGNIVGDSVKAALLARAGLEKAEKDNRYTGYNLRELARASLTDRGVSGIPGNLLVMVVLAFTHSVSDFGGVLADVANKSMLRGWDESTETWPQWTKKGSLPDFKTGHRAGMDGFSSLRKVMPGAEYKYATTSDRSEPIALATYGELFSIDRQAIINDDLDALSRTPQEMGAAARRTIGDLVYAVLLSNSPLILDGLSKARQAMRLQKNKAGAVLNIAPRFLLVPVSAEDRAIQLINSTS